MKHQTFVSIAAGVAIAMLAAVMGLQGCSTLPRVVGAETAQTLEQRTLQTARASLKTWKIVQRGVKIYGALPYCDPEIPERVLCRGRKAWAEVKRVEKATSDFIEGRRALVLAGTDDTLFLVEVTQTVIDAQLAVDAAKGKE